MTLVHAEAAKNTRNAAVKTLNIKKTKYSLRYYPKAVLFS